MRIKLSFPFLLKRKQDRSLPDRVRFEELSDLLKKIKESNDDLKECYGRGMELCQRIMKDMEKMREHVLSMEKEEKDFSRMVYRLLEKVQPCKGETFQEFMKFYDDVFKTLETIAKVPKNIQLRVMEKKSGVTFTKLMERTTKDLNKLKKFVKRRFTDERCSTINDYEFCWKVFKEIKMIEEHMGEKRMELKKLSESLNRLEEELKRKEELLEKIERLFEVERLNEEKKRIEEKVKALEEGITTSVFSASRVVKKSIHGIKSLENVWKKIETDVWSLSKEEINDIADYLNKSVSKLGEKEKQKVSHLLKILREFDSYVRRRKELMGSLEKINSELESIETKKLTNIRDVKLEIDELKKKMRNISSKVSQLGSDINKMERKKKTKLKVIQKALKKIVLKEISIVDD
ncbi:MAG: hypothetical protein J7K98_01475 [Candidatus Aenigmarchaeota archaeon]|nr:hypothetical protein [Candidatus Aenigmarchaeota archaeon]